MKTDDEYVEIRLNATRTQNIKNKELKEKAKEITHLNLRIVNIPLETGEIETLITNLPPETATSMELKTLYGERWQIETGYDILKNKLHIENFSGKKRIIIEQDFYSQIYMYNVLISAKIEFNKKNTSKKKQKLPMRIQNKHQPTSRPTKKQPIPNNIHRKPQKKKKTMEKHPKNNNTKPTKNQKETTHPTKPTKNQNANTPTTTEKTSKNPNKTEKTQTKNIKKILN